MRIGETLGNSGVNIEGLCLTSIGDSSVIHFAVSNEMKALNALNKAGIKVSNTSDIYVLAEKKHVAVCPMKTNYHNGEDIAEMQNIMENSYAN